MQINHHEFKTKQLSGKAVSLTVFINMYTNNNLN